MIGSSTYATRERYLSENNHTKSVQVTHDQGSGTHKGVHEYKVQHLDKQGCKSPRIKDRFTLTNIYCILLTEATIQR
jgi:hypothetical protein